MAGLLLCQSGTQTLGETSVDMLGTRSRFVGRLPVGRKLLLIYLIYLLDLSAVICISGVLINEKYIAINFARKEVAGNADMALVRDTLLALPVPVGEGAQPVDGAAVRRWADNILTAEKRHGQGMRAEDTSRATVAALQGLAADPRLIGNQSDMILDPDLDSCHTMSLALLGFPELVELLARTAQRATLIDRAPAELRARLQTELLILEGQLDAVLRSIESDCAEGIASGRRSRRPGSG